MQTDQNVIGERRLAPRVRTLLGACAREPARSATWDCRVKNLSATGARIETANLLFFPEQFELQINARGVRRAARVVWREASGIGVVFTDQDAAANKSEQDELIQLRLEHQLLKSRLQQISY